jgi:2-(1,2-epoxy-1,2-dihydrophenyl)acetyl-CoA isomerase
VITDRGPVRWLRLDRPAKHNAMTRAMAADLRAALEAAAGDESVRVLVLTGSGPSFSAGADTRELFGAGGEEDGLLTERAAVDRPTFPVDELVLFPKPTIAALNGRAVGGGATMAMAADLRVCATSASLAFTLAKVGLTPEWGSSYLLWRQIGWGRALDLLLTGRAVPAGEALAMGLVSRVVADESLEDETQALAEVIAGVPAGTAEAVKEVLRVGLDARYADARVQELQTLGRRGRALASARRQEEQEQP